jgi:hypothetical protein
MKCAVPGTQVRKYSHNILPVVHTLSIIEISLSTNHPHHGKVHLACNVSSCLYLQFLFHTLYIHVFTPFHRNIPSPCVVILQF